MILGVLSWLVAIGLGISLFFGGLHVFFFLSPIITYPICGYFMGGWLGVFIGFVVGCFSIFGEKKA